MIAGEVGIDVKVFISCGENRDRYRDRGVHVVDRVRDFLVFEYGGPILLNWDYRNDLPRDVPAGEFAARSLEMVDQSQLFIGILGEGVPEVTRQEIIRAYERQAGGEEIRAYLLGDPRTDNEREALLDEIRARFDRDVQYGHYRDYASFVDRMYLMLFRFLIDHGQLAPAPAQLGVLNP